jgi:ubiquinone/menaquinone biosynthesis C-methylase UbiE
MFDDIFKSKIDIHKNFITLESNSEDINQQHTNEAFTEKWSEYESTKGKEVFYEMQKSWYLDLYGFNSEDELATFLSTKKYIFDAGCGLGYKAKWFADLSPNSIVIGMDFSDASLIASKNYVDTLNLYFLKGDIATTPFKNSVVDYVSCDQVIMHTEQPERTFAELTRITKTGGEFACYVYAKKALPRELLDSFFRTETRKLSSEQLWEMSGQLTQLGKVLSDLDVEIEIPDIPLLGIKGGKQNVQRFIYWNFIKCYWNKEQGRENSNMINFDWYSPSNAKRYSEEEFLQMVTDNKLGTVFFHKEEACFSGRFKK